MKRSSRKRKPRPDALSSQEYGRAPGNARRHWRAFYRKPVRVDPGRVPAERAVATSGRDVRAGNYLVFPRARVGKFLRLHELSGRGCLQSFAFGGHGFADPAWRIPNFVYAV